MGDASAFPTSTKRRSVCKVLFAQKNLVGKNVPNYEFPCKTIKSYENDFGFYNEGIFPSNKSTTQQAGMPSAEIRFQKRHA